MGTNNLCVLRKKIKEIVKKKKKESPDLKKAINLQMEGQSEYQEEWVNKILESKYILLKF